MGFNAMNKILIKNAHLISMDDNIGDLLDTDILINDGTIERVEPSIITEAEIIDAKNYLICPGFINGHIHTWQTGLRGIATDWTLSDYLASIHAGLASFYEPDDMYIGNYIGALYQINTASIKDFWQFLTFHAWYNYETWASYLDYHQRHT